MNCDSLWCDRLTRYYLTKSQLLKVYQFFFFFYPLLVKGIYWFDNLFSLAIIIFSFFFSYKGKIIIERCRGIYECAGGTVEGRRCEPLRLKSSIFCRHGFQNLKKEGSTEPRTAKKPWHKPLSSAMFSNTLFSLFLHRHFFSTTTTTKLPSLSKIPTRHRAFALREAQKALTEYLHGTRYHHYNTQFGYVSWLVSYLIS